MTSDIVTCPGCGRRNRLSAAASGTPRCGMCQTPLPWLTSAGDDDFDEIAVRARIPVLVDLWAPWCGPCRLIEPGVVRATEEFAGRLKAVKVNVDDSPRVATAYNARSIPLLLILRDGVVAAEQVGAIPPDRLVAWVRSILDR